MQIQAQIRKYWEKGKQLQGQTLKGILFALP